MGEFDSPLGRKTFASKQLRTFTVDNASESEPPVVRTVNSTVAMPDEELTTDQVIARRRQKIQELNQVTEAARKRIAILTNMGRASRDVIVADGQDTVTYSLRTLKGREMKYLAQITAEASKNNVIGGMFDGRLVALAQAVYAVDGIDLDVAIGARPEMGDTLPERITFLEDLDDALLNRLYNEWDQLVKENNARYAIKTEAEAKEVASDIKKSG